MSLFLKVTQGPLVGQTHEISHGFKIGRDRGDLVLKDQKASGFHAYIEKRDDDVFYVVDNYSKNGTFVDGQKAHRRILKAGVRIQIGDSVLEVVDPDPKALPLEAPTVVAPSPTSEPEAKNKRLTWTNILIQFTEQALNSAVDRPNGSLKLFEPELHLRFIRGLQMDTQWRLHYGPRRIGNESIDLPIFEPHAPALCFEVVPSENGPQFQTQFPDIVRINGQKNGRVVLRQGDIISIYETSIEVDFDK